MGACFTRDRVLKGRSDQAGPWLALGIEFIGADLTRVNLDKCNPVTQEEFVLMLPSRRKVQGRPKSYVLCHMSDFEG
jgi:hypothetical protein